MSGDRYYVSSGPQGSMDLRIPDGQWYLCGKPVCDLEELPIREYDDGDDPDPYWNDEDFWVYEFPS